MSNEKQTIEYNDTIVRYFMYATMLWALVGMAAGVFVAFELRYHFLNFDFAQITFGRLRPLHTNAAIFAFVGNMMFTGIYYSTQRLVKARLASELLSWVHFWGWQLIIVGAAITLPLGLTRGKEYAELIWPINIMVVLIWVIFAVNFFWTLAKRNEPSIYVAIWFYIATIITVAMLYVVNHLQIPTGWLHGYPIFGGVQDGLVQWWYGHNAVAFFLTTPILGIMYYFVPKAAGRPVYSYRLSVVHFWSLVFIYIWAGPHHLLNTALPNWLQSLGMVFSLMLWAPSWGGMLNGLLTLRGAWHKLLTDPIIKFLAAGVTFYGMSTFEGPLLAIKTVNSLSHYTDWTVGHVHSGTLGWNGFMTAGMLYWLAPRLYNTKLHSVRLADIHFYLGMVGILLYIAAMWVSGIQQGLMQNAVTEEGVLAYPNFVEITTSANYLMLMRAVGGALYLFGFVLLTYNIMRTVWGAQPVNGTVEVYVDESKRSVMSTLEGYINAPVLTSVFGIVFVFMWGLGNNWITLIGMIGTILTVLFILVHVEMSGKSWGQWYDKLLENALPFSVLVFVSVAIGGAVQILPTVTLDRTHSIDGVRQIEYTPLELAGREIYVREGCYNCHSQMVRPFVGEVLRYGEPNRLGESMYDYPYQWGSKRTGPDLGRMGSVRKDAKGWLGKYPDDWHFRHMENPRFTSPGSIMPSYPWLLKTETDFASLESKFNTLRTLGVPYPERTSEEIHDQAIRQAGGIVARLKEKGIKSAPEREIIALISYLQKIGQYEKVEESSEYQKTLVNW